MTEPEQEQENSEQENESKTVVLLGREDLLTPEERQYREIYIPEWKGKIRIRAMSAKEGLAFTKEVNKPGAEGMFLAFVASVCDDEGNLLFLSPDDAIVEQLKVRSLSGFILIQDEVLKLNRLGDYALEALLKAKNG